MAYSIKIALLGNYTVDYLKKPLQKELIGIKSEIYIAGFNQIIQEIYNPRSGLYKFGPDLVFIMLQLDSSLYESLENLIKTLCSQTKATVVVNNFYIPFYTPQGILDGKNAESAKTDIYALNMKLYKLSQTVNSLFIFDYNGFVGYHGFSNVFDPKMYYLTKTYESRPYLKDLAREYMRYVYGVLGCNKKCIVLDLDNTLWGGVIGEDGLEGIKLDTDGQGKAYYDFQKALLNLHERGILLTVCSKNNRDDALCAIENHPCMVLRREHFACIMANWDDKASNIRKIAQTLNLGLDSFVFADDNPFERNLVKELLPEVCVLDMPEDAALYTRMLNDCYCFSKLTVTADDLARNRQYAENAIRADEAGRFADVDEYLKSLNMEIEISEPDDFTIVRVHQLINKTNQFNMTTKRYTLEDVKNFCESPDKKVLHFSLRDKFGDNGIVGVAILLFNGDTCEIDTFLMSCRVLGRQMEWAVLNHIVSLCGDSGVKTLKAAYIPTQKNIAYAGIYADYGFQGDGNIFSLQIDKAEVKQAWITNLKS